MIDQEPKAKVGPPGRALAFLVVLLALALASCQATPRSVTPSPGGQQTPSPEHKTERPRATAARFELRPSGTPPPPATLASIDLLNRAGPGYGPETYPAGVNPLTGLEVADRSRLERRPLVIKITNFPRSVRPQWGLNTADHVYEYYLEDELTRFIGVFYGRDAGRVGPIRSARPFDEQIVRAYKGIFAFGYADDRVIDLWKDSDLKPFLVIEHPDNCPPMCRIGPENAYNTLFTDTARLSQYVTDKGVTNGRQRLEGLRFEARSFLAAGGGVAERVETRYSPMSYHYWEYDPATKRYLRWQDADRVAVGDETYAPLVDSLDEGQVAADNLVILFPPMGYFFKSNSTEIYNIQLTGSGTAYALREGRIFKVEWRRKTPQDMISLWFSNGVPYPLKPGNTWFEVLNGGATHKVDGTTWRFQFVIP